MRELAAKVTPGPWESTWSTDSDNPDTEDETVILAPNQDNEARVVVGLIWYNGTHVACTEPNAAHIAAANPAVVLALLDALDAAEARVAKLEGALRPFALRADDYDDEDPSCHFPDEAALLRITRAALGKP